MEILTLHEVAATLKYKDIRAAIKFCKKNHIMIHKAEGSNRHFVFKVQVEQVMQIKLIRALKLQYGKDWSTVFNQFTQTIQTETIDSKIFNNQTPLSYEPNGTIEKIALSRLQNKNHHGII